MNKPFACLLALTLLASGALMPARAQVQPLDRIVAVVDDVQHEQFGGRTEEGRVAPLLIGAGKIGEPV